MPETYKIHLIPPVGDEVAAHKVQLYQPSDDDPEIYERVCDELVPNLTPDPDGDPAVKYWTCAMADAAKPWKIVALSAVGVGRNDEVAQPPRPSDPATFTVYAWTIDAGLGVEANVSFSARPKSGHAAAGTRLVIDKGTTTTDANGYAALTLPADAGVLRLALGPLSGEVNTTGRAGQVINLKDLL